METQLGKPNLAKRNQIVSRIYVVRTWSNRVVLRQVSLTLLLAAAWIGTKPHTHTHRAHQHTPRCLTLAAMSTRRALLL